MTNRPSGMRTVPWRAGCLRSHHLGADEAEAAVVSGSHVPPSQAAGLLPRCCMLPAGLGDPVGVEIFLLLLFPPS